MEKYAIIRTGGKQYKVTEGEELEIEKIDGKKGEKVEFEEVLLASSGKKLFIGQPLVKKALVLGEIKDQIKSEKIKVFKFKAKSRYRRRQGHRQLKTLLKVKKIIC